MAGDVVIDPKLISLINYHGARWRQKYRHWVCPLAEHRELYFALHRLERQVEAEENGVQHRRVLAADNAQHDAELDLQRFSNMSRIPSPLRTQSCLRNLWQISVGVCIGINKFDPNLRMIGSLGPGFRCKTKFRNTWAISLP